MSVDEHTFSHHDRTHLVRHGISGISSIQIARVVQCDSGDGLHIASVANHSGEFHVYHRPVTITGSFHHPIPNQLVSEEISKQI